eukprot:4202008-Prorocentrum_lima.AAC.1
MAVAPPPSQQANLFRQCTKLIFGVLIQIVAAKTRAHEKDRLPKHQTATTMQPCGESRYHASPSRTTRGTAS